MRNKKLNILVKSSLFSRKFIFILFCLFTSLSTILILITIGIIAPLRYNIDNNINNHILNRELITEFDKETSDKLINEKIEKINGFNYVTDVYRIPTQLNVTESSGILFNNYNLNCLHNGFNSLITNGKSFNETDTNVALVPETINDFNQDKHIVNTIAGKDLIGKKLSFTDEFGLIYEPTIVGTYNTSDPIFTGDEILIPKSDLLKLNSLVLDSSQAISSISSEKRYIILIDTTEHMDKAIDELSNICNIYQNNIGIDTESYNLALYILIVALISFVILVIAGFLLFINNNVNNRTNELALYRALGYKSKQIFYIIFTEHLLLGIISITIGIILTAIFNTLIINPYLFTLVGNTIMDFTVTITALQVLFIFIFFIAILSVVCQRAVKRSEKIDLTVLLRER